LKNKLFLGNYLSFEVVFKKNLIDISNSWLFRPNPKFGGQNIAVVRQGIYRNPQMKVPYVTAEDVITPPSPN
jgi:hypothetical protein